MYEQKVAFIFAAIERSGVYFSDFARLTRISRETLYRWKGGSAVKDMLRLDLAYTYAARLVKACDDGKLPLKNSLKPTQRLITLRKIIADTATK